jgi:hypothetical protein
MLKVVRRKFSFKFNVIGQDTYNFQLSSKHSSLNFQHKTYFFVIKSACLLIAEYYF